VNVSHKYKLITPGYFLTLAPRTRITLPPLCSQPDPPEGTNNWAPLKYHPPSTVLWLLPEGPSPVAQRTITLNGSSVNGWVTNE